jgi:SAM-dependent MidA family methyltransferase
MRAAKIAPGFIDAVALHFVEISPPLQAMQEQTIGPLGMPAAWHKSLDEVPAGETIVIANEFFDALPVNQAIRMDDGWHRRTIAVGPDNAFRYENETKPIVHFEATLPANVRQARKGEFFEWRSDRETIELGRRIAAAPGAALIIDYGHAESATGETLQAVRNNLFADPLSEPGEADLTAHVDFEALGRSLEATGAKVYGPIEQAVFLDRLGIRTRAQMLKANASWAKIHDVDAALARLTGSGRTGMGALFKVLAATHPALKGPPAFER